MKLIPNPYDLDDCFFCGASNPVGLKLTFYETETQPNELVCKWSPPPVYRGFGKILHGGIQSGLFDEIMGWTTTHLYKQDGVTLELNVRFLKPLFVEQNIELRCRVESQDGDKINLVAEIKDENGVLCSKATGTYLIMGPERFKTLIEKD